MLFNIETEADCSENAVVFLAMIWNSVVFCTKTHSLSLKFKQEFVINTIYKKISLACHVERRFASADSNGNHGKHLQLGLSSRSISIFILIWSSCFTYIGSLLFSNLSPPLSFWSRFLDQVSLVISDQNDLEVFERRQRRSRMLDGLHPFHNYTANAQVLWITFFLFCNSLSYYHLTQIFEWLSSQIFSFFFVIFTISCQIYTEAYCNLHSVMIWLRFSVARLNRVPLPLVACGWYP